MSYVLSIVDVIFNWKQCGLIAQNLALRKCAWWHWHCTFDSDPVHEVQSKGETALRVEEYKIGVFNSYRCISFKHRKNLIDNIEQALI